MTPILLGSIVGFGISTKNGVVAFLGFAAMVAYFFEKYAL